MITLLNTPILTDYGTYAYEPVSMERAREIIAAGYNSAISHQATADFLSGLFGVTIEFKRVEYRQKIGEMALVFKLKSRVSEGKILDRKEIEALGFDFGTLFRVC